MSDTNVAKRQSNRSALKNLIHLMGVYGQILHDRKMEDVVHALGGDEAVYHWLPLLTAASRDIVARTLRRDICMGGRVTVLWSLPQGRGRVYPVNIIYTREDALYKLSSLCNLYATKESAREAQLCRGKKSASIPNLTLTTTPTSEPTMLPTSPTSTPSPKPSEPTAAWLDSMKPALSSLLEQMRAFKVHTISLNDAGELSFTRSVITDGKLQVE